LAESLTAGATRRGWVKASGEAKLAKDSGEIFHNLQGAAGIASLYRPGAQRVLQNRGAKHAGKVRPTFAPVETGAAPRTPAATGRLQQKTCLAKHALSGIGHDGTIRRQFDRARADQPVGDGDTKFAGNVIVAGPRPPKRRINSGRRPANIDGRSEAKVMMPSSIRATSEDARR
jgi:hypothetical protein